MALACEVNWRPSAIEYRGEVVWQVRRTSIMRCWHVTPWTRSTFTFSDLTQRLVPAAVLHAFPDGPVTDDLLLTRAADLEPSPVFSGTA